jgi:hypothetical protein
MSAGEPPRQVQSLRTVPLGFYSYYERQIYILDTPSEDPGHASYFALVHEMVHAIQDGAGDLAARALQPRSFDEELGEEAVMEGEARYYTQLVRSQLLGRETDDLRTGFAAEPAAADAAALHEPSVAHWSARRFVEAYGSYFAANDAEFRARFATGLIAPFDAVGSGPLLQLRHHWPRMPYESASARPHESKDSSAIYTDSLGPWVVQTFFARATGSTATGREVASTVRSDRLELYRDAGSGYFVTWFLQLQDEESVTRATEVLRLQPQHEAGELRTSSRGNVLTVVGGTVREKTIERLLGSGRTGSLSRATQ